MIHVKPALGLKVAAIALLGLLTAVAVPASAYAGTGPGGRCNAQWTAGYTELGYTAQCAYASGAPGSTSPFNFRVRITCIRTGRPDVTVTGCLFGMEGVGQLCIRVHTDRRKDPMASGLIDIGGGSGVVGRPTRGCSVADTCPMVDTGSGDR